MSTDVDLVRPLMWAELPYTIWCDTHLIYIENIWFNLDMCLLFETYSCFDDKHAFSSVFSLHFRFYMIHWNPHETHLLNHFLFIIRCFVRCFCFSSDLWVRTQVRCNHKSHEFNCLLYKSPGGNKVDDLPLVSHITLSCFCENTCFLINAVLLFFQFLMKVLYDLLKSSWQQYYIYLWFCVFIICQKQVFNID
jgi:hypothetical protein